MRQVAQPKSSSIVIQMTISSANTVAVASNIHVTAQERQPLIIVMPSNGFTVLFLNDLQLEKPLPLTQTLMD